MKEHTILEISPYEKNALIDILGYRRFTGNYPLMKHLYMFGYGTDLDFEHKQRGDRVRPIQDHCTECEKKLFEAEKIYSVGEEGNLGISHTVYYCKSCALKLKMMESLDNFTELT